ncbi:MAG: YkgJ family cysteine cluster protein [Flavobacteriia bacterium]|nr:YkgJ family cysteine cluster protein [Flavobacteriia bacterium]
MKKTKVNFQDKLPLTCTRKGTCCYGNNVFVNPWEIICLAKEKQMTPKEFRDNHCTFGGILLLFNGHKNKSGKKACNQYIEDIGCGVHSGRPLACRLFPLGRQIQHEKIHYIFQGEHFPCLKECPEVSNLPNFSVHDYLKGQETSCFEQAQDEYLEVMQNLGDNALTLLLDTHLIHDTEHKTLANWRTLGNLDITTLTSKLESEWLDLLLLPPISENLDNSVLFVNQHNELLQYKIQEKFESLQTNQELFEASLICMNLALILAQVIGAVPKNIVDHWINIAIENGGIE